MEGKMKNGAAAPAIKEFMQPILSPFNKKSREQWKLGNILLHMAKINTYDFLSIHTHLYILV
jgi:hypothetical protein